MAVDALGRPIRMLLTPGQAHESIYADLLLLGLPAGCVVADKGYDFDRVMAALEERGVVCIPPRSTSPQRTWSRALYRQRNLIERCFAKLKQFRRVATRYHKTASSYAGFVLAACIKLWLA